MADSAEHAPTPLEPLWRQILGRRLRALRLEHGRKLTETATRAGISPQYLSEIERGLKEPSSEMIAAIAGALDVTLLDLTSQLVDDLRGSRDARSPYDIAEVRDIGTARALAFAA